MCGICGVIQARGEPFDEEALLRMRDSLQHRGPDSSGSARVAGTAYEAWLGHTRLQVLDLSPASSQPMLSEYGDVCITFNGEIYNFRELRHSLERAGHRFQSTGDTEIVLRAYQEWGLAAIERFDGMFAIAIWDARRDELILARDRTGKKPLFYFHDHNRMVFGSEIKAVLEAPGVSPNPDMNQLWTYLTFGYVPHPDTFLQGVKQLAPASTLVWRGGYDLQEHQYWHWGNDGPDPGNPGPPPTKHEVATTLPRLFDSAVASRMITDVPIGALLSGGIDSSLVVATMAKMSREPIHTFSIGFPGATTFDETPWARQVAQAFGTRHMEFPVEVDAAALVTELLWHYDQPFADSSAIPTYLVSKLAREHVTVVLTGDGGDEVFGGYDRFKAARLGSLIPAPLARLVRSPASKLRTGGGYYSRVKRTQRFLELAERPIRDRYQSWISVMNRDLLGELAVGGLPSGGTIEESMLRCYAGSTGATALDQILYANFRTYLPDDLNVKVDRMSMAHSLEARSPFLDTSLIDFVARIPARSKVGVNHVKPILRRTFWHRLPASIWNRRKHGFGVPMGQWCREGLRPLIEDTVLSERSAVAAFLRRDRLVDLWLEHQRSERDHSFRFWALLTLELWLQDGGRPRRPTAESFSAA